ncbi:MAG: hypothetical protein HOO96_28055 [Polyangiaceae bacterium]|nr:hypothetical protein [Polyangiaceae bacterium]
MMGPNAYAPAAPFVPVDERSYVRYRITQSGKEVGWVYARGAPDRTSVETWQLYTLNVPGPERAPYAWPSFQNAEVGEAVQRKDVVTRFTYHGVAPEVSPPSGLERDAYVEVHAHCRT